MTEEECRLAFESYITQINSNFFKSRGTGLSDIEEDGYYDLFLNKINGGGGLYSKHFQYEVGDLATVGDSIFKCIQNVKGEEPSTSSSFEILGSSGGSGGKFVFFDRVYLEYDGTNYSGYNTTEMEFNFGNTSIITFPNFVDGVDHIKDLFIQYQVHHYTTNGIVTKTWPYGWTVVDFQTLNFDNLILNSKSATGDNKMTHSIVVYRKV